jgi:glycine betaine/proline transport system substrate-binding protein
MFDAQQTSYEKAVDKYIADHPDRIKEWLAE